MKLHLHSALAATLAGALLLAVPASAETIKPGEAIAEDSVFSDYMGSEGYMTRVFAIAEELDADRDYVCDETYSISDMRVQIHEKITINRGDVEPREGEWVLPMTMTRCGEDMDMTIHSFVTANGDVETTLLMPGETQFYPTEITNLEAVLPQVIAAAGGEQGCSEIDVINATPSAPEGHQVSMPEMKYETWLISGCGTDVEVIWRMEPVEDQMQIKVEGISIPQG
ncbi:MAG: hypothetical protein R3360_04375 [Alphaproteobacteria bacterium]|nr:hypothetical protein [Alphaproteobacteria bacterium]